MESPARLLAKGSAIVSRATVLGPSEGIESGGERLPERLEELLHKGARSFGVALDALAVGQLAQYLKELRRWGRSVHLLGPASDEEIIVKHFVDSLSVVPLVAPQAFLLDLGSGAGFPGLPIKIALPSARVLLLEPRARPVAFLRHMIRLLGLKNATALPQRAESPAFLAGLQGTLDVVVARAVRPLADLLRLGAPYLKGGGTLIAMRGREHDSDVRGALEVAEGLALRHRETRAFDLPGGMGHRGLAVFERSAGGHGALG